MGRKITGVVENPGRQLHYFLLVVIELKKT